jgi:uncharacterized protein (DUF1330 family)
MHYKNAVTPTKEQLAGFAEDPHSRAISMLNLLKFKDKATYPADHELHDKGMSGAEAYALYADAASHIVAGLGGEMVFSGQVERLMLGEVEDLWDMVALVTYPSRAAMFEMIVSDAYRAIEVHRNAGLAGQLNIECTT